MSPASAAPWAKRFAAVTESEKRDNEKSHPAFRIAAEVWDGFLYLQAERASPAGSRAEAKKSDSHRAEWSVSYPDGVSTPSSSPSSTTAIMSPGSRRRGLWISSRTDVT